MATSQHTSQPFDKLVKFEGQEELDKLQDAFIAEAFFLPKEVLRYGKYNVEGIRIVKSSEWFEHVQLALDSGAMVKYDPSEEICRAAHWLAVSVRRHFMSGETYIIVKLWYVEA